MTVDAGIAFEAHRQLAEIPHMLLEGERIGEVAERVHATYWLIVDELNAFTGNISFPDKEFYPLDQLPRRVWEEYEIAWVVFGNLDERVPLERQEYLGQALDRMCRIIWR